MNNAVMNSNVQIFMYTDIFIALGYIPRAEISGPYDNSTFTLLKNCQTLFQSSVLHLYQSFMFI